MGQRQYRAHHALTGALDAVPQFRLGLSQAVLGGLVGGGERRLRGRNRDPARRLVRYREWYARTGKPNEGLKLTAEQVAEGHIGAR